MSLDPTKVLVIIDKLADGGKERRLVELLKGLSERADVLYQLIILSDNIGYDEIYSLKGEIHIIKRKSKKDLRVFRRIHRICTSFRPDIIQACESMAAIYGIFVARILGIKFINASISHAPKKINKSDKTWIRAKLTFPFSNAIVANSNAGLESYHAPAKKSRVIHNGFDLKRIQVLEDPIKLRDSMSLPGKMVIGMVASFNSKKDYKSLILAAFKVIEVQPGVVFMFIGEGPDKENIESMIPENLKKNFKFIGWKKNVESYINCFDIGVLSTFTEGISNAIMEYMVLALPVLATEGGGTKELVVDGITGYLIPQRNPDALANKIIYLLNNPATRKSMGSAGRKRIIEEFGLDKMVDKYIQLYKEIS